MAVCRAATPQTYTGIQIEYKVNFYIKKKTDFFLKAISFDKIILYVEIQSLKYLYLNYQTKMNHQKQFIIKLAQ